MDRMSARDPDIGLRIDPEASCAHCGGRLDVQNAAPLAAVRCPVCRREQTAPARFGDFIVTERLGLGETAVVYAAHRENGPRIALKVLRNDRADDAEAADMFRAQREVGESVRHPNLAQLLEAGEVGGLSYAVVELAERGTLDEFIGGRRRVDPEAALRLGADIARGLEALHDAGILHGDVKPGNVLIFNDGQAKLADFGLAGPASAEPLPPGAVTWASPWYASPERTAGLPEDARSDIYSLGATLYHAVAGRPPFDADTVEEILRLHREQPVTNPCSDTPDLPQPVCDLVLSLMEKDPQDRPATAADVAQQCEDLLANVAPHRGVPLRDALGVVCLVLLMVAVAVLARRLRTPNDHEPSALRPLSAAAGDAAPARKCPLPGDPAAWNALANGDWAGAAETFAGGTDAWDPFWAAAARCLADAAGQPSDDAVPENADPAVAAALDRLRRGADGGDSASAAFAEPGRTCLVGAACIERMTTEPEAALLDARRCLSETGVALTHSQRVFFVRLRDEILLSAEARGRAENLRRRGDEKAADQVLAQAADRVSIPRLRNALTPGG